MYNSLANQLIQSGIIQSNNPVLGQDSNENFFEKPITKQEEKVDVKNTTKTSSKKRLNRFGFEQTDESNKTNPLLSESKKERFFIKFFPKLYKAHLAKNALKELTELDIDANELLSRTIPYGEEESRYKNLIKYLKYANKIQIKIKSKFN